MKCNLTDAIPKSSTARYRFYLHCKLHCTIFMDEAIRIGAEFITLGVPDVV